MHGCIEKDIHIDIQWRPPRGTSGKSVVKYTAQLNSRGDRVYKEYAYKQQKKMKHNRGKLTIKLMKKLFNEGSRYDMATGIRDKLNAMERTYPASVTQDPSISPQIRTDRWDCDVVYGNFSEKNEWAEFTVVVENMQENTPYEIRIDTDKGTKEYHGVMFNLAALRLTKRAKTIVPHPERNYMDRIGKYISEEIDEEPDYESYSDYEWEWEREERERQEREEENEQRREWIEKQRHELDFYKKDIELSFIGKMHQARTELLNTRLDIENKYVDKIIQSRTELFDVKSRIDESYTRIDAMNRTSKLKRMRKAARSFAGLVKKVGKEMAQRISAYEALHPGETIDYSLYGAKPKKRNTRKKNK